MARRVKGCQPGSSPSTRVSRVFIGGQSHRHMLPVGPTSVTEAPDAQKERCHPRIDPCLICSGKLQTQLTHVGQAVLCALHKPSSYMPRIRPTLGGRVGRVRRLSSIARLLCMSARPPLPHSVAGRLSSLLTLSVTWFLHRKMKIITAPTSVLS